MKEERNIIRKYYMKIQIHIIVIQGLIEMTKEPILGCFYLAQKNPKAYSWGLNIYLNPLLFSFSILIQVDFYDIGIQRILEFESFMSFFRYSYK